MATWTHVQTVAEPGTEIDPDPETLAYGSNVTAGSLLVVAQCGSGDPAAVPTDTRGNTYVQIGSLLTTGNGLRLAWWWCVNTSSGANTVTFPVMGTFDAQIVCEYTADTGTITLDDQAGQTFASDAPSSGDMTASVDGTLVLGSVCSDNGSGFTYDPGVNFTERGSTSLQASANDTFAIESRQLASAGTVVADWDVSGVDSGAVAGAVFKATVTSGPQMVARHGTGLGLW